MSVACRTCRTCAAETKGRRPPTYSPANGAPAAGLARCTARTHVRACLRTCVWGSERAREFAFVDTSGRWERGGRPRASGREAGGGVRRGVRGGGERDGGVRGAGGAGRGAAVRAGGVRGVRGAGARDGGARRGGAVRGRGGDPVRGGVPAGGAGAGGVRGGRGVLGGGSKELSPLRVLRPHMREEENSGPSL